MTTLAMDTHKVVKWLREAGFTDQQAETVTDVLREAREMDLGQVATKGDIAQLASKAELHEEVLKLEHRLDTLEHRLTIKLGGMMVVGCDVVAAFVKLL